jgi:hypothetical protein
MFINICRAYLISAPNIQIDRLGLRFFKDVMIQHLKQMHYFVMELQEIWEEIYFHPV